MISLITITGDLGSGKSLVAKMLSIRLNFVHVSVGTLQRRLARSFGMTSLDLNLFAESNHDIDDYLDKTINTIISDGRNYVVESRTAWHILKADLNIYLTVDLDIGAERIRFDQNRESEPIYTNHKDAKAKLRARKDSENRRYRAKYGIDCDDLRNYDVVIDTTTRTAEAIVDELVLIVSAQCRQT